MSKAIRPDHVAIYIRWSTEDQGEGTTLAVQQEACRHYVLSQGWLVREELIFVDDGYSGGNLDRPAMTRLREQVRQGQVDCVVVYKLDRLSRSVVDTVNLVLQEWEDVTYLKSAREPVDTTSAMGKQFFYMLVSFAEWERNVIRERMFGGKLRRARDGKSPGMPRAYGYRRSEPGTFEVVPEEAEVVRLVFNLAEQGFTVRQITRQLNERGFPSRKGRGWNTSMVSKMLHNPIYTGTLVWGRWQMNPRHGRIPGEPRVKRAAPHVVVKTEVIPAIVEKEQYERIQRRMAENRKMPPAAVGSVRLLSGIIKCGVCGSSMEYNRSGPDGKWAYYRCRARVYQGPAICQAPSVPARIVEERVIEEIRSRYEHLVREESGAESEEHHRRMLNEIMTAQQAVEAQLGRLEQQIRRINADYRNERLTAEERRQLLAEIQDERQLLLHRRRQLQAEAEGVAESLEYLREQTRSLQSMDNFRSLPPQEQKQVLRAFIREVKAVKEKGGPGQEDALHITVAWRTEMEAAAARESG